MAVGWPLISNIYMLVLETAVTGMMHRTHHFMVALSLDYYMMAPQLPIIQTFKAGHLKYYPRVIATPKDWP